MRIHIVAVGKLRNAPEADLVDDYISRAIRLGKQLGISAVTLTEIDTRKASTPQAAAPFLQKALAGCTEYWVLDERGQVMSSADFSHAIDARRLNRVAELGIVIGSAEGLAQELLRGAALKIAFGRMVWPHMLARVMLCEQLYRALSIISKTPYHRP